jgi:hypothetical protein
MINSGKDLAFILEKISILRTYISSSGKLNRNDIHKQCENFVMELLNMAYGYDLENLNSVGDGKQVALDLGDKTNGIAFQVTSDKSLAKVDDALKKTIDNKLYECYPHVKFFMLLGKQGSYAVKTDTHPHFKFSAKEDILDFDDLLRRIESCSPKKNGQIRAFVEEELVMVMYDADKDKTNNVLTGTLIDLSSSLAKSGTIHYRHCQFSIDLLGEHISAARIFSRLNEILDTPDKKLYLPVFYQKNLEKHGTAELIYRQHLYEAGASNNLKESVLSIRSGSVSFEFAQYLDNENFVTNLNDEFGSLLTLLTVLKGCSSRDDFHLKGSIRIICTGRLSFNPSSSIFATGNLMSSFELDLAGHVVEFDHYKYDTDAVMQLMQELIHGFPAKALGWINEVPFLKLSDARQKENLTIFQNRIFPFEF